MLKLDFCSYLQLELPQFNQLNKLLAQDPQAAAEILQNKPEIYERILSSAAQDSPVVKAIYYWDQNT